ncbi:hypothetical protein [Acidisoma sp. S159]|uniref:hypothetical protein n=1 Tax=Acidisoma sp. S159 TaxID=1747225 RepID=UPI00131CBE9B|nr:hypothetical protein [Acidisoma sp. S159]
MQETDLCLTMSAAIRAQGRASAHPDDIRASLVAADGIIAYLRGAELVIARQPRLSAEVSIVEVVTTV